MTDADSGMVPWISVIDSDPLYVHEGISDPDDIDLHLQSIASGFPADSPAKSLADDSRNAGAYDVKYIE